MPGGWRKLRGALNFFWSDEGGGGLREKTFCLMGVGGGALKIRIYKNVASFWGGGLRPPDPLIYRITDLHLLQMLAFHLSLGLFTIILANNVTFCQTKRYKIHNGCESIYT